MTTRYRVLRKFVRVEEQELAALLWSGGFFFCVLACFYILRPLRDAMGASGSEEVLSWLYMGTLAGTLLANPIFSFLVSRYSRSWFIPMAYRFLVLSLVAFYLLLQFLDGEQSKLAARAFFVWVSVFNMFAVSVFWGFMADLFRAEQGKRLFGFISVGGVLGAIAGATLTLALVHSIGPNHLILIAAVFLEAAVFCMRRTGKAVAVSSPEPISEKKASALVGIRKFLASPYLIGIGIYMLFYTWSSTFLYFYQARLVSDHFVDTASRTAFFAQIDLYVNLLCLAFGSLITGRLLPAIGVGATIATLPVLTLLGFAVFAIYPILSVLMVFQIVRRAVEYSVAKPGREVLYTPLSREEKYAAKNLIDTFIYRGGDASGVGVFRTLGNLGFQTTASACFFLPLAAAWIGVANWLGRRHQVLAGNQSK